jgi:hypothetical protein
MQSDPNARTLWFWKHSIHLPLFLFDALINLMSRQSVFKEILARLRGIT